MTNLLPAFISEELKIAFYSFVPVFTITLVALLVFKNKVIQIIRDLNIVYKITLSFILISIIPAVIISFISFSNARNIIISQSVNNLENIADLKKIRIEDFFNVLDKDMQSAQDYFNVKTNLPVVEQYIEDRENPNYIKSKGILDGQLKTFQRSKGFLEFILLNLDKEIVYHTGNVHEEKDLGEVLSLSLSDDLLNNHTSEGILFSEIFRSEYAPSGFELLAMAPVHGFNDEEIGYIIFAVDMGPIYTLIQDTTGLGKTGETLVGKFVEPHIDHRVGGHLSDLDVPHVFFLNPLRHDVDAALDRAVILGSEKAIPIQEASQGKSGSGISVDYRGEQIVAAWRFVPRIGWGLVAKKDVSEEFAPVRFLQTTVFAVVGLSLVIVLILGYLISRTISQPISNLSKAMSGVNSKGITDSDIPFIKNISEDEVGELTSSFKNMVNNLKTSSEELSKKLEQLEKFRKLTVGRELKMIELKKKYIKKNN